MKVNIYKYLITSILSALLLLTIDISAATGTSEEAVKELERRQFETERKLREKERIGIELEKSKNEKEETGTPNSDDVNKFLIHKIILQNDELLSKGEKRDLLAPYIDKEISYNDITILVRSITNVLIEKGYITARVKVPLDRNIKSGEFTLTIVNGYISEVVPEKDSMRDRLQVFMAFPFLEKRFLNIEDLDYGIEQMNRLRSNNAAMKIHPGEDIGSSRIVISNESGNRLGIDIGFDNLGQKSTGEYRGKINVNVDDLLSINDNISFDYTRSLNSDQDRKYSRSYSMFFSFPLGYWTFSSTYSRSEYMQYISGLSTDFKSSGNDTSTIFGIDKMLGRYKLHRFKLKTALTLKAKENYIEDAIIDSSSRKLTIMKAGLDYSTYLFGGYYSATFYYHRGLPVLDAYKDSGDLQSDTPRAQFNKFEINTLWNKPFTILGQSFGYLFNFSGQYGMETLYSSEKISIGDMNSVRGFKNSSISGDRGFYIKNELSVYDFSALWSHLRGLKYFIGYDYGYTIEKAGKEANYGQGEGHVMGVSTGISYSSSILNMSLTYGRKLFSSEFVKEKEHVIYCAATLSLTGSFEETRNLFNTKSDKVE